MDNTKEHNIKEFKYSKFSLGEIYFKARYLILMGVSCLIGGAITGAPLDWLLVISIVLVVLFISLYVKCKKENGFANFKVGSDFIEVNNKRYLLENIKAIECIEPTYGREKRLGFNIEFDDGQKYIVLQRINNYLEFYQYLKAHNIQGTSYELVIHDNVDEYGITVN